jgi:hypothetical protein
MLHLLLGNWQSFNNKQINKPSSKSLQFPLAITLPLFHPSITTPWPSSAYHTLTRWSQREGVSFTTLRGNIQTMQVMQTCRSLACSSDCSIGTLCCRGVEWSQSRRTDNSPSLGCLQPALPPVVSFAPFAKTKPALTPSVCEKILKCDRFHAYRVVTC